MLRAELDEKTVDLTVLFGIEYLNWCQWIIQTAD